MKCELCGSKEATLIASVEGARLNLCIKCGSYGKVIGKIMLPEHTQKEMPKPPQDKELTESIVPDYSRLIKEKREALKLTQEDFAKHISEKLSLVHKIETGHIEPSMPLARKMEKFLKIRLVEEIRENGEKPAGSKSGALTIGDILKIKKCKNL